MPLIEMLKFRHKKRPAFFRRSQPSKFIIETPETNGVNNLIMMETGSMVNGQGVEFVR